MMEKYLRDTLSSERLKEVDRIAHSSLMPSYIPYLQYIEDSARAANWLERYKDSSAIKKFQKTRTRPPFPRSREKAIKTSVGFVIPDPRLFIKNTTV